MTTALEVLRWVRKPARPSLQVCRDAEDVLSFARNRGR